METVARRKIFRDIVRGYSTAIIEEEFVYIKHLTPHDQVELEEVRRKYHKIAQKRGVPTEKDMLDFLVKEDQWSDSEDKFIEEKNMFIDSLKKRKKKWCSKSAIDKQSELIDQEQKFYWKNKIKSFSYW